MRTTYIIATDSPTKYFAEDNILFWIFADCIVKDIFSEFDFYDWQCRK